MASASGAVGPWVVNGQRIPTASTIYELTECDRWWWRQVEGGITHHADHGVITGIRIGTQYGCEAEFLDHRTIMTRVARTTIAAASAFQRRLEYAERTMREQRHIGVIAHKNHATFAAQNIRFPASEVYAVLGGWWVMTDLWVDWQQDSGESVKVLMAKLELVDATSCWWLPGSAVRLHADDAAATAAASCPTCRRVLVARYVGALFCGRPDCPSSNSASTNNNNAVGQRLYRPEYVAARAPKEDCAPSFHTYLPLPPQPLTKDQLDNLVKNRGRLVMKPGWQAYLCASCYTFNQRVNWAYLRCRRCRRVQHIGLPALDVNSLIDGRFTSLDGGSHGREDDDDTAFNKHIAPLIQIRDGVLGRRRIHTSRYVFELFELEDANSVMVGFPKWATIVTDLAPKFSLLQSVTRGGGGAGGRPLLDLVRAPTKSHRENAPHGDTPLTAWFGNNFGVPYKTRMEMPNVPMGQAPLAVALILEGLTADVHEVLARTVASPADAANPAVTPPEFNEALLIGNYPGQGMNWHCDGEESVVGDVVASVSLGGLAHMSFGLKRKYYTGKLHQGKRAVRAGDPVFKGTAKETEKRQLRAQYDDGDLPEHQYEEQMDRLVRGIKASRNATHALLRFPLPFGAIMIQHGKTLNDIYLHKVEMGEESLVRFVLTARKLTADRDASRGVAGLPDDHDFLP